MLPNGKFPKSFTKGINKTTKLMLKVHIHVNVVFEPILSNFSYLDNTMLFTCIGNFIQHTYFPIVKKKNSLICKRSKSYQPRTSVTACLHP